MLRQNHFIWTLGLSIWIYYLLNFPLIQTLIFAILTAILSPLPDIDLKIIKYFKNLNKKTFYLTYPIYILIKIIFKHRSTTHSLLIPLTLFFISKHFINSAIINQIILIPILAITLHIFEDMFTISGVNPIYPLPIKNIRFAKFKTNSSLHHYTLIIIGTLITLSFPIYIFNI